MLLLVSFNIFHQFKTCLKVFNKISNQGGMQDYNYIFHGTMELTLEISCCKYPLASTIEQHWLDNKKVIYVCI